MASAAQDKVDTLATAVTQKVQESLGEKLDGLLAGQAQLLSQLAQLSSLVMVMQKGSDSNPNRGKNASSRSTPSGNSRSGDTPAPSEEKVNNSMGYFRYRLLNDEQFREKFLNCVVDEETGEVTNDFITELKLSISPKTVLKIVEENPDITKNGVVLPNKTAAARMKAIWKEFTQNDKTIFKEQFVAWKTQKGAQNSEPPLEVDSAASAAEPAPAANEPAGDDQDVDALLNELGDPFA